MCRLNNMNLITQNRHAKITDLFEHAWYGKRMNKFTPDELTLIANFINERSLKERNDFVFDVNRYFINKVKTKNWSLVMEILTIIA